MDKIPHTVLHKSLPSADAAKTDNALIDNFDDDHMTAINQYSSKICFKKVNGNILIIFCGFQIFKYLSLSTDFTDS